MASLQTHCEDCSIYLGLPYEKVHKWLDAYASSFPPPLFGEYHRSFRHNSRGVQLCQEYFGGESGRAAIIHIVRDLNRWYMRPFDSYDLDDLLGLYKELNVKILNNPEGVFDCIIPPQFLDSYHNETGLGYSAIIDVYNVNPERKV
jgi:hypothetical protein